MKTLYLCGGINGCTDVQCNNWRNECRSELKDLYEFLDPMRRDYRGIEDESVDEIVRGDIADVACSDYIIVNATKPSWGTAMEVKLAHSLGKRIYATVGSGSVGPWLRYHCDELFETWEQMWDYMKRIYDCHLHVTEKSISEILEP